MNSLTRTRLSFPAVLPILLAGAGCMATTGTPDLQEDLDQIQTQLWKVQKDTASLSEKVDQIREQRAEPAVIPQTSPESATRMDAIQNDLQILQSRLDEMNFRLDAIIQEIRLTRTPAPAPGAGDGFPEEMGPHPVEPSPPAGSAEAAEPTAPGKGQPEELYLNAYADFSKGNYQLAVLGFREYVRRFPESELADNAQYWVGESLYSSGKFDEAIEAFDELIRRFPYGDQLSRAHLKKGLSYLEENQTPQGVVELQYVVKNFPRSDEARLARDHLSRLAPGLDKP